MDWFTPEIIEAPDRLAADLQQSRIPFVIEDISPGTLQGNVSGLKTSFLQYVYPLLGELYTSPELGCQLASLDDLTAMKLAAVSQRGSRKGLLDIYELGIKHAPIESMLELYEQKYAVEDIGHVLLGLSYFDDTEQEPMPIVMWDVNWGDVKKTIRSWVKGYVRTINSSIGQNKKGLRYDLHLSPFLFRRQNVELLAQNLSGFSSDTIIGTPTFSALSRWR